MIEEDNALFLSKTRKEHSVLSTDFTAEIFFLHIM